MIADAVSSRSSKEDKNHIVVLETERLRAEERTERIRQDQREEKIIVVKCRCVYDDDDDDDVPRFPAPGRFRHLLSLKQALFRLLRQLRNSIGNISLI